MTTTILYAISFGLITLLLATIWTTNKNTRIKALIAGIILGTITGLVLNTIPPNTTPPKPLPFMKPAHTKTAQL